MIDYLSLAGGLVLLLVAGDALVRGAVSIARALGIPSLVIGLTVVAFGTSAPELVISLRAAFSGIPGIAIGNVVGSNIANVLMVLGAPALIATTLCADRGVRRNASFLLIVTIVFIAMCWFGELGRPMGVALLALLALFLYESVRATRRHRKESREAAQEAHDVACEAGNGDAGAADEEVGPGMPNKLAAVALVVAGLIGLPVGGQLVINGAVSIAREWGVTDTVIGLTVIALGTSLPELATALMAALRKQSAMVLGNVIGSNVFNLLAILGTTAVIVPLHVPKSIMAYDIWVMLATTVMLTLFAFMRVRLRWPAGLALVSGYCAYILFVFVTGKVM